MRPKVLLLALCAGVILGQNEPALVGLPEYGVTLTGTADNPEIVNNSGKAILAYVVWSRDANGRGPLGHVLKTRELRLALVRPASASGPTATPPHSSISSFPNVGPIVQATSMPWFSTMANSSVETMGTALKSYRVESMVNVLLRKAVSNKRMSWDEVEEIASGRRERPPQASIEASIRHAAQRC